MDKENKIFSALLDRTETLQFIEQFQKSEAYDATEITVLPLNVSYSRVILKPVNPKSIDLLENAFKGGELVGDKKWHERFQESSSLAAIMPRTDGSEAYS